jgi:hypothetical protein
LVIEDRRFSEYALEALGEFEHANLWSYEYPERYFESIKSSPDWRDQAMSLIHLCSIISREKIILFKHACLFKQVCN